MAKFILGEDGVAVVGKAFRVTGFLFLTGAMAGVIPAMIPAVALVGLVVALKN